MNDQAAIKPDRAIEYQTDRLQELLAGMVTCCDEQMLYEARKLGLANSEMLCLRLYDGEKYLTVKGIAQRLGVAKSRVTKIIDGLAGKNLVTRTDDPNDARSKLISLTPAGLSKAVMIQDIMKSNHRQVLEYFLPEERQNLLTMLESLRSAMETVKAGRR